MISEANALQLAMNSTIFTKRQKIKDRYIINDQELDKVRTELQLNAYIGNNKSKLYICVSQGVKVMHSLSLFPLQKIVGYGQ